MSVVVLLSGGVDSLVCAELARERNILSGLVFVNYGHPAQTAEAERVFAYHKRSDVPLWVVHTTGLGLADMEATSQIAAGSPRVVPARNGVLIALAANRAAIHGASEVWIGAQGGDDAAYADCRSAWIDAMSQTMHSACGVRVVAPLIDMNKRQVIAEARRLGIMRDQTWACYNPIASKPCMTCVSCLAANHAWGTETPIA
jgi:7-cyano-7-deazaguanine synthase